jgi:acrylyl-CoA reductase (NADPH)
MATFRALLLSETGGKLTDLETTDLPPGEILVEVKYSSLNYKDAMAIAGRPGVVRKYPMVPGIDLAGVVVESDAAEFPAGSEVAPSDLAGHSPVGIGRLRYGVILSGVN